MTRTTDRGSDPGGRRRTWWRRVGAISLVTALLALVPAIAGSLTPRAGAAAPSSPGTFTITPQDGAWLVELRLDAPLPVRAAQPTLLAVSQDPGGSGTVTTDLGVAQVDPADLTLVRVRSDSQVLASGTVTDVVLGWDGEATPEAMDGGPQTLPAPPPGPALTEDPIASGTYDVGTAFYNLGDEVVDLAGIAGRRGEMRGVVYYPTTLGKPAPVVLFLHGRHPACADGRMQWPCSASGDIPSYLGYQQMGQLLASQGFVVVSISANAINALDQDLVDNGDEARANLVLQTLDRLSAADQGGSPGFPGLLQNRLDLTRVGLMGHSRGGEAVVRAAQLNAQRPRPFGIQGVFPLAPTDVARLTLPGIPMATLLPYCDGDVVDLAGQAYLDDSRHAFGDDESVLRASLLMLGANHNYFNTVWSPGGFPTGTADDWSYQDEDQSNPICGQAAPGRLTQDDQRKAGAGYLAAFFRLTLAEDSAFLPMFDGSAPQVPTLAPADVRVLSQTPRLSRTDLFRFDTTPVPTVQTSGSLTATVCAGYQAARRDPLPACSYRAASQLPHWSSKGFTPTDGTTPMLDVQWDDTGSVTLPVDGPPEDLDGHQALSIWLAAGELVTPAADIGIDVVGTDGTVAVSAERILPAATALPGEKPLGKILLRQIRVPVEELAGIGRVTALRLTARSGPGSIYLSDVSLVSSSAGSADDQPLPVVRVVPTAVDTGRLAAGTARVAVLLDRRSSEPLTGRWAITAPGSNGIPTDYPLALAAGTRCAVLILPADDDPTAPPVDPAALNRTVTIADLAGSRSSHLTAEVRVQAAPTDGLAVGVQADPCTEATTPPGLATVSPASAAPGAQVVVTGQGYRIGETVLFAVGSGPTGARAVAGADGRVTATLTVPGDATGSVPVTLTGYGSGRTSTGGLQVVAGPTTPTSTSTTPTSTTPTTPTSTSTTPSSTTSEDPPTSLPDPFTSDPFVPADPVTLGQFTVPDPGYVDPGYVAAPAYTTPTTTGASSNLAQTGVRVAAFVIPALLLLAGGATLVLLGRRPGAHGPGRRR